MAPLPPEAYVDRDDVEFDIVTVDDERRALDEWLRALRATRILNLPITMQPCPSRTMANQFLAHVHRTHGDKPVAGWKFAIGAWDEVSMVGLVVASRPTGNRRGRDTDLLEITRLAVMPGPGQVGSQLLGAAARAATAMGYRQLISYALQGLPGTVYRAAGWHEAGKTAGGSRRSEGHQGDEGDPRLVGPKTRWQKNLR